MFLTPGRPSSLLRIAALVLVFVAIATVSGGGCRYRHHDDDDDCHRHDDDDFHCHDDDDFDDDDLTIIVSGSQASREPSYRLESFDLERSLSWGWHPNRYFTGIGGLSLSQLGAGVMGREEFLLFTDRVIEANPEWLGLPDHTGWLRFESLVRSGPWYRVNYVQESLDPSGVPEPVPGTLLSFTFDSYGELIEILNYTRILR